METPAGKECKHYYEDFHRGRDTQECRLVKNNTQSMRWRSTDCFKCPVPAILNANASPDMELTLTIEPRAFGLGRKLTVTAHCRKHDTPIEDPYIGCPKHAEDRRDALDIFRQALEEDKDD